MQEESPARDSERRKRRLGMRLQNCWGSFASWREEDGWLSGAPNSALSSRNGNGNGQPRLSVPDGHSFALASAASSGELRAFPEAALSASLWYAFPLLFQPPLLFLFSRALPLARSLCCIVINSHPPRDVVLRQGQRLRRLALSRVFLVGGNFPADVKHRKTKRNAVICFCVGWHRKTDDCLAPFSGCCDETIRELPLSEASFPSAYSPSHKSSATAAAATGPDIAENEIVAVSSYLCAARETNSSDARSVMDDFFRGFREGGSNQIAARLYDSHIRHRQIFPLSLSVIAAA